MGATIGVDVLSIVLLSKTAALYRFVITILEIVVKIGIIITLVMSANKEKAKIKEEENPTV